MEVIFRHITDNFLHLCLKSPFWWIVETRQNSSAMTAYFCRDMCGKCIKRPHWYDTKAKNVIFNGVGLYYIKWNGTCVPAARLPPSVILSILELEFLKFNQLEIKYHWYGFHCFGATGLIRWNDLCSNEYCIMLSVDTRLPCLVSWKCKHRSQFPCFICFTYQVAQWCSG